MTEPTCRPIIVVDEDSPCRTIATLRETAYGDDTDPDRKQYAFDLSRIVAVF